MVKESSVTCKDSSGGQQRQRPASVIQRRTRGHLPEVTIRKDFKIKGQIGEKEQKDKLSYMNLLHQMDLGLQKGYPESEIVEAVINAISPGLSIRGMLEMKTGLTLVQLLRILQSYYKEEDAAWFALFHVVKLNVVLRFFSQFNILVDFIGCFVVLSKTMKGL